MPRNTKKRENDGAHEVGRAGSLGDEDVPRVSHFIPPAGQEEKRRRREDGMVRAMKARKRDEEQPQRHVAQKAHQSQIITVLLILLVAIHVPTWANGSPTA